MSGAGGGSATRTAEWHRMLLALAGRLPDEVVARCRAWLADGRTPQAARAVVLAASAHQVGITGVEAALLAAALADGGEDARTVDGVGRVDRAAAPAYGMAPTGPDVLAEHGDEIPFRMDLSVRHDVPGGPDAMDGAAVRWCAADGRAHALWRSWRYPAEGTPQGPARRLYLVQAREEAGLAAVAADLQAALAAAGEAHPQVEVFVEGEVLPAYQQRALGFSALLWTAAPARAPRLAPDAVPADPGLPDAPGVAAYLDAGEPLSVVTDVHGARAEAAYRTDGTWIWPAAAGDAVRARRQDPGPPLLAHVRGRSYQPAPVGIVAAHRALCVLYRPSATPAEPEPSRRRSHLARPATLLAVLVLVGAAGIEWAAAGYGPPPAGGPAADRAGVVAPPPDRPGGTDAPASAGAAEPAAGPAGSPPRPSTAVSTPPPRRSASPRAGTPSAAPTSGPPRSAAPAGRTRVVTATAVLRPGEAWSTDRLSLAVTGAGDVVLRDRGRSVWSSGTTGRDVRELVFQADGNLVLYAHDDSTVWSSATPGNDGATLTLGGDGNVRIGLDGRTLWQTGTGP
ncbi:hypothetical protein [Micromonospora haikouensis]|uniref:hypothetical protein n=1 Tax=Micromonospora haikouensis TaxID=686309 RepID=UPI003D719AA9